MIVHDFSAASPIPHSDPCASNTLRDFAKGVHVVILSLLLATNSMIDVHNSSPLLSIPQPPDAFNTLRDFANGAHVVILQRLYLS